MELHKKFYIKTGKMHRVFVAEGSSVGQSFWYNSNDYVKWLEEQLNKVVEDGQANKVVEDGQANNCGTIGCSVGRKDCHLVDNCGDYTPAT